MDIYFGRFLACDVGQMPIMQILVTSASIGSRKVVLIASSSQPPVRILHLARSLSIAPLLGQ